MNLAQTSICRRADGPCRICLSVPASSEKIIRKAQSSAPDQSLLDLEDSMSHEAKTEARGNVNSALQEGNWEGRAHGSMMRTPNLAHRTTCR
ncbi:aldolase/citrate lyase family protein [Rhodococcoides fascians]|uniref:aldolase/citrate lyase family protein n=1 Tax=Rhodococcoides fascians TaxID=1828 RepID=UPI0018AF62C3